MDCLVICVIFVWVLVFGKLVKNLEWIEFFYLFNNEIIYWLIVMSFYYFLVFENFIVDGYYYVLYDISVFEYGGIYIDVLRYFVVGKWIID